MLIKQTFNAIANTGIKKNYLPWEISLTRKLNISALLGIFNVICALLIFVTIGYREPLFECMTALCLAPFVFILNKKLNYIYAIWLFAFIGCFLFYFISVESGPEAFCFLYFFPLVMALVQMTSRKELFRQMVFLLLLCLFSVVAILVAYSDPFFESQLPADLLSPFRTMNIFFSFFTSLGFMFIVSKEAVHQEQQLKTALQQKELLLAELFHRVKNNLNIVTSLLNLKKNSSNSPEAREVLEECRTLVFSMALVHTRIYNSNKSDGLNFEAYLQDLLPELINSIGGAEVVEMEMSAGALSLDVSQAIPCGLIVNELITNSFKHAQLPGQKLKIKLQLKENNQRVEITVSDNGPGMAENLNRPDSLGMELIKSLTEQLEGKCRFINNAGLHFILHFQR